MVFFFTFFFDFSLLSAVLRFCFSVFLCASVLFGFYILLCFPCFSVFLLLCFSALFFVFFCCRCFCFFLLASLFFCLITRASTTIYIKNSTSSTKNKRSKYKRINRNNKSNRNNYIQRQKRNTTRTKLSLFSLRGSACAFPQCPLPAVSILLFRVRAFIFDLFGFFRLV